MTPIERAMDGAVAIFAGLVLGGFVAALIETAIRGPMMPLETWGGFISVAAMIVAAACSAIWLMAWGVVKLVNAALSE